MTPKPVTLNPTPTGRRRGRPPGTTNAARAARLAALAASVASEPPPKRRRYIPGGPGGGGRFIDLEEANHLLSSPLGAASAAPRSRVTSTLRAAHPSPSSPLPRRERSTRIRSAVHHSDADDVHHSSAAAVAAAVVQSEGYKPREERSWEEFHPNLDIDTTLMIFSAEDVDRLAAPAAPVLPAGPRPYTPISSCAAAAAGSSFDTSPPLHGSTTPTQYINLASAGNTPTRALSPSRRRIIRPTRDSVAFLALRSNTDMGTTSTLTAPKVPKALPILNQTPKERLDLKNPAFRRTDRVSLFESKIFGQARYVDKAMSNVGYQESDRFARDERALVKAAELNLPDDLDQLDLDACATSSAVGASGAAVTAGRSAANEDPCAIVQPPLHHSHIGRVEYDMDEQDDMWLEIYNDVRKANNLEVVTREVFEIAITKIEMEWHALERRIPKPNPKPPQMHRPRSGSAAAVNGEPQIGEEQDTKCAVCDDGDCENTNAIVFCDGCDLAVHQECYGVPFIPEGQWLCRKCQLVGRGVSTCIFCPNTDGAFKQTNSSKWAHLLCAMWIPEVSLGNHTFMEPVMDVDKVPKTRWKLACYICNQKMGACIQCGNKACYQAFHVTCARRARLFLKMKTSQGALAVLDGNMVLKAFCDKHAPPEYAVQNSVARATKAAKKFYKRAMRGVIWADSHATANAIATSHRQVDRSSCHDPSSHQITSRPSAPTSDRRAVQQPPGKHVWKLASGAPVIPQAVFDVVEASIQRFGLRKRKDFVADACKYWTLKREARRGAALLKRLQLQMETFSSMELIRRDFTSMGAAGKTRLARRVDFARLLVRDLEQLRDLSGQIVCREEQKLQAAELEKGFVDICYFPVTGLLAPALERAMQLDKKVFHRNFAKLKCNLDLRLYINVLTFAHDLCEAIHDGINAEPPPAAAPGQGRIEALDGSVLKANFAEPKERKKLGKRILKGAQPHLESALRLECDLTSKTFDEMMKELEAMMEGAITLRPTLAPDLSRTGDQDNNYGVVLDDNGDVVMAEAALPPCVDEADESTDNLHDRLIGGHLSQDERRIEPHGSQSEIMVNIVSFSAASSVTGIEAKIPMEGDFGEITTGCKSPQPSDSPSSITGGFHEAVKAVVQSGGLPPRIALPTPPTPPQSNGSLGKEPIDQLAEGGVPWYLKSFDPRGTTVTAEWWDGLEVIRGLSEELSDMDEEELQGLGMDLDLEDLAQTSSTIPASEVITEFAVGSRAHPKASTRGKKRARTGRRR